MSFDWKNFMNVPYNLVQPVFGTDRIGGAITHVTAEVVVAKIIRQFINAPPRSWSNLAFIHLISLPFLGGPVGFLNPNKAITSSKFNEALMDGAKGIPGVLLAQYVVSTADLGFHVPSANLRDLMVMAAAKILTRPLLAMTSGFWPETLKGQMTVFNKIIANQVTNSNLKPADA